VGEPTNAEILAEIRSLREAVTELQERFDQAAGQVNNIAEMAGPAIEQLTASPMMRMLTGGKRRGGE
jgi:hypothetical protein